MKSERVLVARSLDGAFPEPPTAFNSPSVSIIGERVNVMLGAGNHQRSGDPAMILNVSLTKPQAYNLAHDLLRATPELEAQRIAYEMAKEARRRREVREKKRRKLAKRERRAKRLADRKEIGKKK